MLAKYDTLQCVSLPICCIQVFRGRPGGLRQFPGLWPPFIAMTWHNAWCAGVVASSLTTWPNNAWRLLLIISAMLGRPVLSAMSMFLTWSCHFTPSIWRWHDIWKDCNLPVSSASKVHVWTGYEEHKFGIVLAWCPDLDPFDATSVALSAWRRRPLQLVDVDLDSICQKTTE